MTNRNDGLAMHKMIVDERKACDIRLSKRFRTDLDALLQTLKVASNGTGLSEERTFVAMKIQEAIMWPDADLKMPNSGVSCYEHGCDLSNAKVDPPADGLKFRAIALRMSLFASRVSQIHQQALERLFETLEFRVAA